MSDRVTGPRPAEVSRSSEVKSPTLGGRNVESAETTSSRKANSKESSLGAMGILAKRGYLTPERVQAYSEAGVFEDKQVRKDVLKGLDMNVQKQTEVYGQAAKNEELLLQTDELIKELSEPAAESKDRIAQANSLAALIGLQAALKKSIDYDTAYADLQEAKALLTDFKARINE